MTEPIIITKIKDYEGKLCWQCPFDKTLYLFVDNFIKHMALLHNINIPELMEELKGLLRCKCRSYFVCKSDLEDHEKVCCCSLAEWMLRISSLSKGKTK